MPVKIMLLTQEGCNPCKRVKRILSEIVEDLAKANSDPTASIEVEEVSLASKPGMQLAVEHQILYPPAVFIDGQLFVKGKIREDELRGAVKLSLSKKATLAEESVQSQSKESC
ncbi:MAG: thioredoxin family protein [Nitrososphaerales archaeon]